MASPCLRSLQIWERSEFALDFEPKFHQSETNLFATMSDKIDVWALQSEKVYLFDNDPFVKCLLKQLGVPNLFAAATEFDAMKAIVAFDNHPTHWIIIRLWKGAPEYSPNHSIHRLAKNPSANGLLFEAIPKTSESRAEMEIKLSKECSEMAADSPFQFQQLPGR